MFGEFSWKPSLDSEMVEILMILSPVYADRCQLQEYVASLVKGGNMGSAKNKSTDNFTR